MKYRLLENDTIIFRGRTLYRIQCVAPFANVNAGEKGGYIEKEGNLSQEGNACVCGNAELKSSRDYMVFKNYWSSGRYFTYTRSDRMWTVGCFHGTGEELIKKAYEDSEDSGRHYEAFVRFVEQLEKMGS